MLSRIISRSMMGLILALALLLGACNSSTSGQTAQQLSTLPLHVRLIIDRAVFTKPGDLCNPILTAEVIVGSHGAARWNTPNGQRPPVTTSAEIVDQNYFIYRPVTFGRFIPLHDRRAAPTVEYITVGGWVGQDSYEADELPQLPEVGGHYVVVFAPPVSATALARGDVMLASYAFPVTAAGTVILQQAGDPNEPGIGTPQPAITIPLADLTQLLASCKN